MIDVTPVSIHGDTYFDVLVQLSGADSREGARLRVPLHACAGLPDAQPREGQRLAVQVLMGQVTGVSLAR